MENLNQTNKPNVTNQPAGNKTVYRKPPQHLQNKIANAGIPPRPTYKPMPPKPPVAQTQEEKVQVVKPQPTQEVKQQPQSQKPVEGVKKAKKAEKQPLSNQSKGILFGLLGGFFLFGAAICIALMFIL